MSHYPKLLSPDRIDFLNGFGTVCHYPKLLSPDRIDFLNGFGTATLLDMKVWAKSAGWWNMFPFGYLFNGNLATRELGMTLAPSCPVCHAVIINQWLGQLAIETGSLSVCDAPLHQIKCISKLLMKTNTIKCQMGRVKTTASTSGRLQTPEAHLQPFGYAILRTPYDVRYHIR